VLQSEDKLLSANKEFIYFTWKRLQLVSSCKYSDLYCTSLFDSKLTSRSHVRRFLSTKFAYKFVEQSMLMRFLMCCRLHLILGCNRFCQIILSLFNNQSRRVLIFSSKYYSFLHVPITLWFCKYLFPRRRTIQKFTIHVFTSNLLHLM